MKRDKNTIDILAHGTHIEPERLLKGFHRKGGDIILSSLTTSDEGAITGPVEEWNEVEQISQETGWNFVKDGVRQKVVRDCLKGKNPVYVVVGTERKYGSARVVGLQLGLIKWAPRTMPR